MKLQKSRFIPNRPNYRKIPSALSISCPACSSIITWSLINEGKTGIRISQYVWNAAINKNDSLTTNLLKYSQRKTLKYTRTRPINY